MRNERPDAIRYDRGRTDGGAETTAKKPFCRRRLDFSPSAITTRPACRHARRRVRFRKERIDRLTI